MNYLIGVIVNKLVSYVILLLGFLVISQNLSWSPIRSASAAVGDLLQTVDIPVGAQCSSGLATSLAIVPGSALGMPNIRILLVTSCYDNNNEAGEANNLYFLDPSTDPATLVRTINSNFSLITGTL